MIPPAISIIIPVFNSANVLASCIASVQQQRFESFEVILVDDGSEDESAQICSDAISADERFRLVMRRHSGIAESRNVGLESAIGEYVLFLDSDDWLEPHTCERAVALARTHDCDVVLWAHYKETIGGTARRFALPGDTRNLTEPRELSDLHRRMVGPLRMELSNPLAMDLPVTVTGKLYRRSIVEDLNLRFVSLREIGSSEDALFNMCFFGEVRTAYYTRECLYHYRRDSHSSFTTSYRPELPTQWRTLFGKQKDYIGRHGLGPEFHQALSNRVAISLISLGLNEMRGNGGTVSKLRRLSRLMEMEPYASAVREFDSSAMRLHWRLLFTLFRKRWISAIYGTLLAMGLIREVSIRLPTHEKIVCSAGRNLGPND